MEVLTVALRVSPSLGLREGALEELLVREPHKRPAAPPRRRLGWRVRLQARGRGGRVVGVRGRLLGVQVGLSLLLPGTRSL